MWHIPFTCRRNLLFQAIKKKKSAQTHRADFFFLSIQLMINHVKYFLLFANHQENSRNDQCGSQPKSPGNLLTQK